MTLIQGQFYLSKFDILSYFDLRSFHQGHIKVVNFRPGHNFVMEEHKQSLLGTNVADAKMV